ncbi:MAG: TonB-dependent receptor [Candidatus Omnitrophica bacterium]|nr:TonB-dependent receptor [Candidatus Omnitrophota bacterium]
MKKIIGLVFVALLIITANSAYASVNLDTIVVTGSRLEQKEYRVASNVTVITQEQIEASNANSLPDLLRYAQGLNIYDNSTSKTAVVDIRGFGDTAARNVLVLINGRKVNSIDVSGPDLSQIPIGAVERVEIIRGAGSVLYGDNAVGGVVNIITKKGQGDFRGKLGANYASYNSSDEHLELSGSKGKMNKFSYFLYSKYSDQRGYRENSDDLAKDFNTRLGYEFSQDYAGEVEVGWHEDDSGLPGGLLSADLASKGRRATTNPDDYSSTKDRYVKVNLKASPSVDGMYFGGLTLDLLYRNRDVFDSFNTFGPFHTKRSIDTYGVAGKYAFDRTIFNKEVNFVTGIDYYDNTNDILGSGDNVDDITIKKKEFGIYEHLQYELIDSLFVSTGTRYNHANYEFHQRNVVVDQEQTPDQWVNSGGLKYEYAKGSNLHFSWQQTFRFLATDEWYSTANFPGFGITPGLNLDLKQQSGEQYEVGVKHNFRDTMVVGITPYLMVNKNEIFFDPVTFANSNYDKTRRFGIEFDQKVDLLKVVNFSFLDKLDLITTYTYQNPRFDKGANDGKFIPMVPTHSASQTLYTEFLQHFNFSLTGRFVGSRYAINDVQNSTPLVKPHQVLDTKLAYKAKDYEIYVAANNIFDMRYSDYVAKSTSSSDKSYFPAPERNFSVGMDWKF